MANIVTHEKKKAWQMYGITQARYVSEVGPEKECTRTDGGLWGSLLFNIPTSLSIRQFAYNVRI